MRKLLIKTARGQQSFDIPDEVKTLINWDNIPEICFIYIHDRNKQEDNALTKMDNGLRCFNHLDIEEVIVQMTPMQSISFKIPVLNICYRTIDYMAGMNFKQEENLAIKFVPEQDFLVAYEGHNGKKVCCDFKRCRFLEEGHCNKYKTSLQPYMNTYIVCEQCFCTVSSIIAAKELRENYEKMRSK